MSSEEKVTLWNRGYKDAMTVGIVDPFIGGEAFGPYYEGFQAGRRTMEKANG